MSLFKQSYARGACETLIRAGLVKFASVADAEKVADVVGLAWDVEPSAGPVSSEKVAGLIIALLEKSANTGALITGEKGEQKNTPENAAAQVGGLAALDQKMRPQGQYAMGEKGVGKTEFKIPAGSEIGTLQAHPKAPGNTDHKANSVNSKSASLNELIRKIASGTGSLVTGHDAKQENTPTNAADEVGGTAAMDQGQRPQGEYAKGEQGVGKSEMAAPARAAAVGKEEEHPKAPGNTDHKGNSANEQSKSAAYVARFEETAREYLGQLPASLDENEKVAAVKHLMGLDPSEAEVFVSKLAEEAGMPAGLAEAKKEHEEKESKNDEKDEKKEEEMKEEAKKEASEKEAAPHRRKYQDPYGYKKYDAINVGPSQKGPQQQEKKASATLAGLRSLISR